MAHTGETVDPQEIDGKIAQIDEKVARLSCLQEELERQRPGKRCPACGKACQPEDAFCRFCGQRL